MDSIPPEPDMVERETVEEQWVRVAILNQGKLLRDAVSLGRATERERITHLAYHFDFEDCMDPAKEFAQRINEGES